MTDNNNEDRPVLPSPSAEDHAYTGLLALLQLVPGLGGSAAYMLERYFPGPLQKRTDQFLRSLNERLEGKLDKENLSSNEEFITTCIQATSIAIKTHQQEKLDALRSAVENVALGRGPSFDVASVCLALVDQYTPLHMHILKTRGTSTSGRGSQDDVRLSLVKSLLRGHPEQDAPDAVMLYALRQLEADGLIIVRDITSYSVRLSSDESKVVTIHMLRTDFGNTFVNFISPPTTD